MIPSEPIRCIDCQHWNGNREIDPEYPLKPVRDEHRDGECSELHSELHIELTTGWDGGFVNAIRTVATFWCAYGKNRRFKL